MAHPDDFGGMSPEDWNDFQSCVKRFEEAWRDTPDSVKIDDYLPPFKSTFRSAVLYELVKIDLENRWDRDQARPLDWYLEQFPDLGCAKA